jgi:hypothetical protein
VTARVTDRAAQRALLERFVAERPFALGWDGEAGLLVDVAAGKTLRLDWARVAWLEERRDADSGRPYLALALGDGASLALADQGLAFAPDTGSTGPLPGLPRAVCHRDLQAAEGRLTHFLLDHPDDPAGPGHVDTFRFCLAVVDGARAVGFDVGPEERRLERILGELEARRRG